MQNEKELFNEYIINNDFTVSGFSYGAIKALEYTLKQIKNNKRVDKLQLFSPAYFVNKDDKYKRLQLMYFKKDKQNYINNFIKNVSYPSNTNLNKYLSTGTYKELEELLNYIYKEEDLEYLIKNNVIIEVYLGKKDKIIDANYALDFFKNYAEVYFIKNTGHSLE